MARLVIRFKVYYRVNPVESFRLYKTFDTEALAKSAVDKCHAHGISAYIMAVYEEE